MGENERFVKSNYSNAVVERDGALFFCSTGIGLLRKDLGAGFTREAAWQSAKLNIMKENKEREYPMMVATPSPCDICGHATFIGQFEKDKELIEAVKVMRELQRAFFRDTRDKDVLSRAKAAERRVDALLAEMDSPQEKLL